MDQHALDGPTLIDDPHKLLVVLLEQLLGSVNFRFDPGCEVDRIDEGFLVVMILIHLHIQFLDVFRLVECILVEPCYFLHGICPFGLLQEGHCANVGDEGFDHVDAFAAEGALLSLEL